MPTLLSVFGINPFRIGGQEAFARELSLQLDQSGWKSVLCFAGAPMGHVREYLSLPNVVLEVLDRPEQVHRGSLAGLSKLLRLHRPKILHLYYTGFVGPYPWLARLHGVRHVFFTDQSSRPSAYSPKRAPLWKRGLVRVINYPITRVVCASGFGHRCMTTLNLLPADRFTVIYNAVDLDRARPSAERAASFRRKYGISDGIFLVTQVSWIIPEKGIVDLLEAARILKDAHQPVHFALVGEGDYRSEYTRRAVEMGVDDCVTWTGLVEDPFSEGVYDAADIVCQVSRWEELFGYVIAEAMAYAKPVLATQVGGIPELVQDGETGYLVPRGDAAQIADRIVRLAGDAELRARMGQAGRRVAEEKFDVRKNVAQLMALYGISAGRVPSNAS